MLLLFFFFKQKTAYEMRISDWTSDVCSSDLLAALNACMMVGYVAQCALRGIVLESLDIETQGDIDLRGFLGLDPRVAPGYESLSYTVRIKGDGTPEQFAEIHEAVKAT